MFHVVSVPLYARKGAINAMALIKAGKEESFARLIYGISSKRR